MRTIRHVSPLGHIQCECGHINPLMHCCCKDNKDPNLRCVWCTWWDEHEPHDPRFYEEERRSSIFDSVDVVVDMMNKGNVNPDVVYPKGRYQGD